MIDDLELIGLDGWINSDPLFIADLLDSGRVVLLDFWTYTCVNCLRTFPYLSAWHETYAKHGLTLIGVHSPEFEFERLPLNVQRATERYGIDYPVALDGGKATWERYGNHFWPSKYLIGASGEVVFRHFGEGGYDETESIIRTELEAAGNDLSGVARSKIAEPRRSEGAHTVTRELYGGYSNNYLPDGLYAGQDAYYEAPDVEIYYSDDVTRRHGQLYLDGRWTNSADSVISANRSADAPAYFVFDFFATAVNSVLGSGVSGQAGTEQVEHEVLVELDGRPLLPEEAGEDIEWDPAGNSVLRVTETRLYQLLELPEFGKHELKLTTNSEDLAIFTVTFGIFELGP
ncbi:MAG: redoxin family protein [Chloroflexi bacterium]|nr:redoxin family protein [Chloroflexota bacterium]